MPYERRHIKHHTSTKNPTGILSSEHNLEECIRSEDLRPIKYLVVVSVNTRVRTRVIPEYIPGTLVFTPVFPEYISEYVPGDSQSIHPGIYPGTPRVYIYPAKKYPFARFLVPPTRLPYKTRVLKVTSPHMTMNNVNITCQPLFFSRSTKSGVPTPPWKK